MIIGTLLRWTQYATYNTNDDGGCDDDDDDEANDITKMKQRKVLN